MGGAGKKGIEGSMKIRFAVGVPTTKVTKQDSKCTGRFHQTSFLRFLCSVVCFFVYSSFLSADIAIGER